jgi:GT2 family glycosyltransferase
VSDQWLAAYAALDGRADLAGGPVVYFRASESPPRSTTDVTDQPPVQLGFLPYAVGTNIAMSRAAFERVGGFPEDWPPAEDIVVCWRLQLDGIPLHYATDAIVWKRRRATMRGTLREYYWYGRRDPELMREFDVKRAHGQPWFETAHVYLGLVARLPLLFSETQRERWSAQAGRRYGRIVGSFKTRTFCP